MKNKVFILDSTLRDGAQGQGISFSVEDKLKIVKALDDLGIDYIEAGNPGSNQKDLEFFKRIQEVELETSKIVAFGSTRRSDVKVEDDKNLKSLLEANTDTVVIFGKSDSFQVTDVLKTTLDKNLEMIKDTIEYLVSKGKKVIFDGEHFFDGYKNNSLYAMKTLDVAKEAGADTLVLCDTNGGSLQGEILEITKTVKESLNATIGVHAHNDMGLAVGNSLIALEGGATHIQGTFLGIGERCGNANLSAIIPTLKLKLGYDVLKEDALKEIKSTAMYISEICNIPLKDDAPYIGESAFAHKGGMHIDAVCKIPVSYEHINPELVGNSRRFLVSEVSGKSTIYNQIKKIFPHFSKDSEEILLVTERLKQLEYEGYQFEGADGTVELVTRKTMGKYKPFFELKQFKVIGEQPSHEVGFSATAVVELSVDNNYEITAAQGQGPVNALDKALRKALEKFYPQLGAVRLVDYKVRVLDSDKTTASRVRVLIESTDGEEKWSTVGVSEDIIQASWIALVDSIEYKLIKDIERKVKTYF